VTSGGTLGGTGTVGNTQINSAGVFAPGSGSAGTAMTVAGNLAFQSGALYLVQVNSTTASFANVTGTASLAGTVDANVAVRPLLSLASRSVQLLQERIIGRAFKFNPRAFCSVRGYRRSRPWRTKSKETRLDNRRAEIGFRAAAAAYVKAQSPEVGRLLITSVLTDKLQSAKVP
jgi:hypothetical protein